LRDFFGDIVYPGVKITFLPQLLLRFYWLWSLEISTRQKLRYKCYANGL